MEFKQFKNTFVIRIDRNEEIVESLTLFCKQNSIKLASLNGIGAAKNIVTGYFDSKTKVYNEQAFTDGSYEIASMSGNVAMINNEPVVHLHVVLGDAQRIAFAGHLKSGVVSLTCEVILQKIEGTVERKKSEEIGLNLFDF
ncbi:DNA-binding protein [Candidatus Peregrinibacteria bacterium]|nr:DNA-binding protein [Candidatus Peregrinibacteria bacterium]